MSEKSPQLSLVERKIVDSARRQLPEIAEENCPCRNGELCRNTGEPCGFSACPLVDKIAQEYGD